MNTNKAWRLNISTAAQWNSGLENLLTSITVIHLLQIREKQKENVLPKRRTERHHIGCKFKMSPYLQSRNFFFFYIFKSFFFFDPTGSGETTPQTGGRLSWKRWTSAVVGTKASLTDTSMLTLDRLEDISQLFFVVVCFHFALKPKMHSL